jgi:hypothetical protein
MPTNTNSHPNAAGVAALMEKIHHQHAMGGTVRIPVADWLTIYNAMTSDREKYAQSIGAAQTNSARSESVHRWIPVTERLPTKEDAGADGGVLAFVPNVYKEPRARHWRDVRNWMETSDQLDSGYWMPLPKEPK